MPLNERSVYALHAPLLCRLLRVHCRQLLLQLREEVLAGRHEMRHVAWLVLTIAPSTFGAYVPRDPHAPVLLLATESPWTLWKTEGWSDEAC
jgi:hypothetical protein